MANRPRPRCPRCQTAMEPVFARRTRGKGHARVPEAFWCRACGAVGLGRARTRFLA